MRRARRLLLILALIVAVGGGAVFLAARFYLTSAAAVEQVASRLREAYGGAVEIEGAGEGIADRVEVRRHVQTPDQCVVAAVDEDRQVTRVDQTGETADQLGGAGAASESHRFH